LLQIWILPNKQGLTPSYEDGFFSDAQKQNQWCLLASENAEAGSLKVHQDMTLWASKLGERNALGYALKENRSAYLQVASGSVEIDGRPLNAGDAAMFDTAQTIEILATDNTEILLFDLPKV
jgi:redox-sensitive bicupin YhaK (pirin superfamily)